jgi:hypothetical protein
MVAVRTGLRWQELLEYTKAYDCRANALYLNLCIVAKLKSAGVSVYRMISPLLPSPMKFRQHERPEHELPGTIGQSIGVECSPQPRPGGKMALIRLS